MKLVKVLSNFKCFNVKKIIYLIINSIRNNKLTINLSKMSKPNIFKFATKELSQDAFFAWLLQWADADNSLHNKDLHETAKDFLRFLLNKPNDFSVNKVIVGRQLKKIDVWAEVNDEYFLAIEDNANYDRSLSQLNKYKEFALNRYKDKKYSLIFIYLKTGNESLLTLKRISEKGFRTINRQNILEILNSRKIDNTIFNDFRDYLSVIENDTNSFLNFENITSNRQAGEGFYIKLQEHISTWTDWKYKQKMNGGFLTFYYPCVEIQNLGNLSVYIENGFDKGIKVVIKISTWKPNTDTLRRLLTEIKPIAEIEELKLSKPDKLRAGASSTVAIVEDAFTVDHEGNLKIDEFLITLKKLQKTMNEYSRICNSVNIDLAEVAD